MIKMGKAYSENGKTASIWINLQEGILGKPWHRCEDNIRMNPKEIYVNMTSLIESEIYL